MSSLIAAHFPSFSSSSSSPSSEIKEKSSSIDLDHQNDRHLSDQELDFLVAILGLLVNLVEKDGHNRLLLLICLSTCPPAFVCCSWFLEMLVLLTINCHTDSTMHLFLPPLHYSCSIYMFWPLKLKLIASTFSNFFLFLFSLIVFPGILMRVL